MLKFLEECSGSGGSSGSPPSPGHEFRPCNAFELSQVKSCAEGIVRDHGGGGGGGGGIDALVMTQGMATIQSFTPTSEGNDEKLTLHYWSRAAFASCLLPALRTPSVAQGMPGGPVVLTVLSGGVHSPYKEYKEHPELRDNYSIRNAADCAGYYSDLFFDKMARMPANASVNFVHAAPGVVASNWGTEMPWYLRYPIRGMQKCIGKSLEDCANEMVKPILQCSAGSIGLDLPARPEGSSAGRGLYIMTEEGKSGKITAEHTADAMDSVWDSTKDVLGRAGIQLEG